MENNNPQTHVDELTEEEKALVKEEKEQLNEFRIEVSDKVQFVEDAEEIHVVSPEEVVSQVAVVSSNDDDDEDFLVLEAAPAEEETIGEMPVPKEEVVGIMGEEDEGTFSEHLDAMLTSLKESNYQPIEANCVQTEPYTCPPNEDGLMKEFLDNSQGFDDLLSLPSADFSISVTQLKKIVEEAEATNNVESIVKIGRYFTFMANNQQSADEDHHFFGNKDRILEQGYHINGKNIAYATMETKDAPAGKELLAESAFYKALKFLRIGDVVRVPLWHSGFWVTIAPPKPNTLVSFHDFAGREKVDMGRETFGYTFTNTSVSVTRDFYEFIKEHIIANSIKGILPGDIDDRMLITDMPLLENGMICAMHPDGAFFKRICSSVDISCSAIHSENINFRKLLWVDKNALSETQKEIFNRFKGGNISIEDQKNYVSSARYMTENKIEVMGANITLRVPTVAQWFADGERWISDTVAIVEKALVGTAHTEKRQIQLLNEHMRASYLRNWMHFIESIEMDGNVVIKRDAISGVLTTLGSNSEFLTSLETKIMEFRNKAVLADIGIPTYECPHCKEVNEPIPGSSPLVKVIPLETKNLFFLMYRLKFQLTQSLKRV